METGAPAGAKAGTQGQFDQLCSKFDQALLCLGQILALFVCAEVKRAFVT